MKKSRDSNTVHWKKDRLPAPVFLGFFCGSAGKESACSAGDLDSIPGLGRSPGEGKGYPSPVFWPGEFHLSIFVYFTFKTLLVRAHFIQAA